MSRIKLAPVAQLDRAPDYGSGGWGFESLRARQQKHRAANWYLKGQSTMFKPTLRRTQRMISVLFWAGSLSLLLSACVTSSTDSTTSRFGGQAERPSGFFDRMADAITERECNVLKFTCPYGFGPAKEPCECVDPQGVVLKGWTIK